MIRIKFKNKDKELMFLKDIHFLSERFGYGIKYAEMISDLDVAEKEHELQCLNVDPTHEV